MLDQAMQVVLTVDVAILRQGATGLELLLVQRGKQPYAGCWALPGGKLDFYDILPEQAACREVYEETGVQIAGLQLVGVFGAIGRDPRGRYVSVLYAASTLPDVALAPGGDAMQVAWFPLASLPSPLAFDHDAMVAAVLARL